MGIIIDAPVDNRGGAPPTGALPGRPPGRKGGGRTGEPYPPAGPADHLASTSLGTGLSSASALNSRSAFSRSHCT